MTIQNKSNNSWIHDKTKESKEQTANWLDERKRRIFNKKTLNKRVPILTWLPKYNKEDAVGDLVAGFTVGLTVIPQALAFAGIAGLPVEHGLYASFLGCVVYILLGSSKDVPIGPTAMSALLVFQVTQGDWQKAVLLTFLTGIIEICMGFLQLGFLLDFVSGPVSAGFTSAVALLISSSQVKDIFGIKASGPTFLKMWASIIDNIQNLHLPDTLLGCCCIIILLLLKEITSIKVGPLEETARSLIHKNLTKILWLIGTSRNALSVITCAVLGANTSLFTLVGKIPSGMPGFEIPSFSFVRKNNGTETIESFEEVTSSFGAALIIIPLISLLENMAVCTSFANGRAVDATQELIAIGASNIANSLVQGFCSTGGLARGAVQNASGVRTQLANLYTALIVMIALQFFNPCFSYIPKACLAAVIITAVIFMVQYKVLRPMWNSKKIDLIPGLCTFIACLVLRIQIGILVGITINFIFILYQTARPKINIEKVFTPSGLQYLKVTPDRCLIFPSVEFVRSSINKEGIKCELPIVIDCTFIYGADFTAAKIVSQLIKDFEQRSQKLLFFNLKPSVVQVFEGISPDLANYYDIKELEMELAMAGVVYV